MAATVTDPLARDIEWAEGRREHMLELAISTEAEGNRLDAGTYLAIALDYERWIGEMKERQ